MTKPLTRILYVEDEPDIRMVAEMALQAVGGFTVIACASGQEALNAAPGAAADLLLLDVMMPGMDGPTTLKGLRELPATANTPVIFMTAKVQAAEVAVYKSLGALEVIPKPFDPMELSTQIQRIWAGQG
ncbi:MAG: response regulator [Polaromonas sp.]|uniref:response regulator n=1 Tax=Polaromonas sp. TaxID=1869339 RepID=UPI0032679F14